MFVLALCVGATRRRSDAGHTQGQATKWVWYVNIAVGTSPHIFLVTVRF